MRLRGAVPSAILLTFVAAGPARAYRPFDQTDADVAEPRHFELELGPFGYWRDASGGAFTPGFVLNYGVVPRLELVFDAHHALLFGGAELATRRRALDTAMLAKVVVREGSLQARSGPSVAVEGGTLLPTVPTAGDPGLSLTAIVSQRWAAATLHLDAEGDLARDGTFAFIGGGIVEGPSTWRVRPVAELFAARDAHVPATLSALAGAIWRVNEGLSFDAAVRAARQGAADVYELRVGLTWAFAI